MSEGYNFIKIVFVLLVVFSLFACDSPDQTKVIRDPVAFEKVDECHVCGMVITRFPGPKAQAFETRNNQMKKFCSTIELMYWYLQPENRVNVDSVFVHDMSHSPWDKPDDGLLIDASKAYYVIGSDLQGSMGKTLATFSSKAATEGFILEHGGRLVGFEMLTLDLLAQQL